jgi:hypothetical protein
MISFCFGSCSQEVLVSFETSIIEKELHAVDSSIQSYVFGIDKKMYIIQNGIVYPTGRPYTYDETFIYIEGCNNGVVNKWRYEIMDENVVIIKNNYYSVKN